MVLNISASSVKTVQFRSGAWGFVLQYRGVTYPVQGKFPSEQMARAIGETALKQLEANGKR